MQLISFDNANDDQLLTAAKFAGIDETRLAWVLDSDTLTKRERKTVVGYLQAIGYNSICVKRNFTSASTEIAA